MTPSTSSPDRRKSLVPRPPTSSLRPSSPSPSTPTTPNANYSAVTPHAVGLPLSPRHSAPSTPPPKSRARDLLRKHYGLGVGPPPPLPGKGADMDPMNLDSTAFDAKNYYEQLITTSSLPNLLKKENDLLTEIRELDSERQSLVYNHHHELIAASDTIAAMKTRAESLDADLDLLKVAFSEISRLASEIATETSQPGHTPPEDVSYHRMD